MVGRLFIVLGFIFIWGFPKTTFQIFGKISYNLNDSFIKKVFKKICKISKKLEYLIEENDLWENYYLSNNENGNNE